MTSTRPIAFFAFADGRGREELRHLSEEEKAVWRAMMRAAGTDGMPPAVIVRDASLEDVWSAFDGPLGKRIAIFHFGGHADGRTLLLETATGARSPLHAAGLAKFLGTFRESLKLVFLNGCSTEPQVMALRQAGVPAVIATSCDIGDGVATEFAAEIYTHLAAGAPLAVAFTRAVGRLQGRRGDDPRSFTPRRQSESKEWPWSLYPDCESDDPQGVREWVPFPIAKPSDQVSTSEKLAKELPYLCDRRPQEDRLKDAINSHREKHSSRPLAVLVHGEHRQALTSFARRLRNLTLPDFLHKGQVLYIGPLDFNDRREGSLALRLGSVRRDLAKLLLPDKPDTQLEDLVTAVAARQDSVMIDVLFADYPQQDLMSAWLKELAGWSNLPEGQDLLFLLRFGYPDSAAHSRLAFWRRPNGEAVEKLVKQLEKKAPQGLHVVALPPLDNIDQGDIRRWIDTKVRERLEETGYDSQALDCLGERAGKVLGDSHDLPMEELAPKLRHCLRKCL